MFRLAVADNKPAVRFRMFYAGTDSWYFGPDNFGVYSLAEPEARLTIGAMAGAPPVLTLQRLTRWVRELTAQDSD